LKRLKREIEQGQIVALNQVVPVGLEAEETKISQHYAVYIISALTLICELLLICNYHFVRFTYLNYDTLTRSKLIQRVVSSIACT